MDTLNRNIQEEFQKIYQEINEWKKIQYRKTGEAEKKWQSIFEKVSQYVYLFPKARFHASDDTCSDFFLFAVDYIQDTLIRASESENAFYFYFAKSLRNLYYKMIAQKKKKETIEEINESYWIADTNGVYKNSADHWDVIIYRSAANYNTLQYQENFPNEMPAKPLELNDPINSYLAELDMPNRIILKLSFGFLLKPSEMDYISQNNEQKNLSELMALMTKVQQKFTKQNLRRAKILERIDILFERKRMRDLTKTENKELKNIQKEYYSFQNQMISIRDIAQLLGLSKSNVQRILQKTLNVLKSKLLNKEEQLYDNA